MSDLSKLSDVIGLFYESIVDDDKWLEALQAVADFSGGTGAFYLTADPQTGAILHSESTGVDPLVNEQYLEYYSTKEVRVPPAIPFPVGMVFTEEALLERRVFERSEIYGELLSPFDIPHVMAVWIKKTKNEFANVVVEGSHRQGTFSAAALERFSLVVPHIIRAADIRANLSLARQAKRAYLEVLQSLPLGVALLDESGRVLETSVAADKVLRRADRLFVSHGRLAATLRESDRRLQRAIRSALQAQEGSVISGQTIAIRSPAASRFLSVTVIPLSPHEFLETSPRPAVMVLMVDPEATPHPTARLIREAFALTEAEACLANALFCGMSLRETAGVVGRSINTCKSQLKSIYHKTNCRNHADLAKKLLMTALVSTRDRDDGLT